MEVNRVGSKSGVVQVADLFKLYQYSGYGFLHGSNKYNGGAGIASERVLWKRDKEIIKINK